MSSPSQSASRTRWTRWRHLCQLTVALLYLVIPLVNRAGYHHVSGTLAALKIGPVELVEPSGALSAMLAGRHVAASLLIGIMPVAFLALLAGPVFCSWVCPWGFISEWIHRMRDRRAQRGGAMHSWVAIHKLRVGSIVLLLAISAVLALPLVAILSPPRLITALSLEAISLKTISPVTGGLILLLLGFELFGPRRLWCRALCPVGTVTNFLRLPVAPRIVVDGAKCYCTSTALCQIQCAWGIDPRHAGQFDSCTNCMRCVEACPSGALNVACRPGRPSVQETA